MYDFPGGTYGKNLSANAGDKRCKFNPLARKIPEEEMTTNSSILAWRIL